MTAPLLLLQEHRPAEANAPRTAHVADMDLDESAQLAMELVAAASAVQPFQGDAAAPRPVPPASPAGAVQTGNIVTDNLFSNYYVRVPLLSPPPPFPPAPDCTPHPQYSRPCSAPCSVSLRCVLLVYLFGMLGEAICSLALDAYKTKI